MSQRSSFWDRTAEKYAKQPIRDLESYNHTIARTRAYLSAGDEVLELGCGTGSTALLLSEDVRHITASDFSPGMIRFAIAKAEDQGISNTRFLCADIFDSAVGDGPYDAVMAFNLLHLVDDPRNAVRRIRGLLKPGGYFISKTPCEPQNGAPISYRAMRIVLPTLQWLGQAPPVKFMKTEELDDLVAPQGFELIEVGDYPLSPPGQYIVAKNRAC